MVASLAFQCPECNSEFVKLVESRILANGSRRRRIQCCTCEYRWTDYDGEKPSSDPQDKSPLTDDDVRLILTSDLSGNELAPMINRSAQTVAAIRKGTMYRNMCPDLPRWNAIRREAMYRRRRPDPPRWNDRYNPNGLTCASCYQWRGVCGLGIPESALEGVLFAQECAVFDDRTNPDA